MQDRATIFWTGKPSAIFDNVTSRNFGCWVCRSYIGPNYLSYKSVTRQTALNGWTSSSVQGIAP